MINLDLAQGSAEWFSARAGRPTASNFDRIITDEGKPSKQRQKYLYELAGEAIAGPSVNGYQSFAMERGKVVEAEARTLYEVLHDVEVKQVGLCFSDEKKLWSASPDGLFGELGLEIKCPLIHTQVGYLLQDKLPQEYFPQAQGGMFVTGLKEWEFFSYYPGLRPVIHRVKRDESYISNLGTELRQFFSELQEVIRKIR